MENAQGDHNRHALMCTKDSFCNNKATRNISILPLDASQLQGYLQHFVVGTHLYTWVAVERSNVE